MRLALTHRPDVILMDLRMPGMDGIAAIAQLRDRLPSARVLVLTTYADNDTILPALRAGACGYLPLVQERLVAAVTAQPPPAPEPRPHPLSSTRVRSKFRSQNR